MAGTMEQQTATLEQDEQQRVQEQVDFKMVTFSLGGKDYGIDIMRVKEIAKFLGFTYVPNTAPFVRGVYNLRGDIISIIDLRLMFNLPAEQKGDDEPENGLILRLESNLMGVVVDRIDKVVGISSSQVQPPHPIFGDINVKYISGVAEHEGRLYIILDVDRIFARETEEEEQQRPRTAAPAPAQPVSSASSSPSEASQAAQESPKAKPASELELQSDFVKQGLATFSSWHLTAVNQDWFEKRLQEWHQSRSAAGKELQLADEGEAREFLAGFMSQATGAIWPAGYAAELASLLPDPPGNLIHVWNPGCGSGHESYSIASMLREHYPDAQIKVWAGDKDLMKISTAPNLVVSHEEVPEQWRGFLTEGKNGPIFDSEIRDAILFEFSDVLNTAGLPKMDFVIARDLLSLHSEAEQGKMLELFEESLKPGGALVLGDNERVPDGSAWHELTGESLSVYRRR